MLTSICFTLRLNGAPLTKSITKLSVTMLTTGKISDANLTFLTTMLMSYAKTGKLVHLSASMKKGA